MDSALRFFRDEYLDNKFFLEIIFNIDNDKVKECIDTVNSTKLDFMDFVLPTKVPKEDGKCNLIFKTKPNSKITGICLGVLVDFAQNILELETVENVRFNIYEEDNSKRFTYNANKNKEEFDYEIKKEF